MNEERLEKLAVFLDSLPDKLFDFTRWVERGQFLPGTAFKRGGGCGTTGCAVGWAPQVFEEWHWYKDHRGVLTVGLKAQHREDGVADYCATPLGDAREFFDLEHGEDSFLFVPHDEDDCYSDCDDYGDGCQRPDGDATAKDVAAHIRRFIKAGGEY